MRPRTIYRRTQLFLVFATIAIATVPADAQKQPRRILVSSEATCRKCTLQIGPIARIHQGANGAPVPQAPRSVARDSKGRIYFAFHDVVLPSVFDKTGNFIRELGQFGATPATFDAPAVARIIKNDTILVMDLDKLFVFDPQLRQVKFIPFPFAAHDFLRLANGEYVAAGSIPSQRPSGLILYRMSPIGNVQSSIRLMPPASVDGPFDYWNLAPSNTPNRVWLTGRRGYKVSRINPRSGTVDLELERRPSWYVGWTAGGGPPMSRIQAVHEDTKQRLWTLVSVPSRDWKMYVPPANQGGLSMRQLRGDRLHDTVLEVIDVKTGRLLYSERLQGDYGVFLDDGSVVSFESSQEGDVTAFIWRMTLSEGAGPGTR